MNLPSDIRDAYLLHLIVAYVFDTILDQEVDLDELTSPAYKEFSQEIVEGILAGLADEN